MKYILERKSPERVMITLHGTGGTAEQLFDVATMIDAEATLLGIQGDIVENGMNRYFKRFPDGNLDLESLETETSHLHETIEELLEKYELTSADVYILGYSNGANMIVNMMKKFELLVKGVFIFHPAAVNMEVPYKKGSLDFVFITSGEQDPYLTPTDLKAMVEAMQKVALNVETFVHSLSHTLIPEEILKAKQIKEHYGNNL